MEFYLVVKKKKILPFATVWMDLENIMLSEISQTEKDKYHMISFFVESYVVFVKARVTLKIVIY